MDDLQLSIRFGSKANNLEWNEYCHMALIHSNETPAEWKERIWLNVAELQPKIYDEKREEKEVHPEKNIIDPVTCSLIIPNLSLSGSQLLLALQQVKEGYYNILTPTSIANLRVDERRLSMGWILQQSPNCRNYHDSYIGTLI
nr:8272_t:CDS:2 [Entrophospora candida]